MVLWNRMPLAEAFGLSILRRPIVDSRLCTLTLPITAKLDRRPEFPLPGKTLFCRGPHSLLSCPQKRRKKRTRFKRSSTGPPLKRVSMGEGATDALLSFGALRQSEVCAATSDAAALPLDSLLRDKNEFDFTMLPVKLATRRNLKGPYSRFHALRAGAVEIASLF